MTCARAPATDTRRFAPVIRGFSCAPAQGAAGTAMHVPPPPVHPANPARRPHPPIPAVARRFGALALSLLILLAACQLAIPARAAAAPGPKGAEAVPNQLIVGFR